MVLENLHASGALVIFWWLIIGHAFADYGLQSEFIAKGKNHKHSIAGVPWFIVLSAHCLMHAGFVSLFTGSALLGFFEFFAHFFTDFAKSNNWFGKDAYRSHCIDQAVHVIWKIIWVLLLKFFF